MRDPSASAIDPELSRTQILRGKARAEAAREQARAFGAGEREREKGEGRRGSGSQKRKRKSEREPERVGGVKGRQLQLEGAATLLILQTAGAPYPR